MNKKLAATALLATSTILGVPSVAGAQDDGGSQEEDITWLEATSCKVGHEIEFEADGFEYDYQYYYLGVKVFGTEIGIEYPWVEEDEVEFKSDAELRAEGRGPCQTPPPGPSAGR